jgi:general secretion pathway protein K
MLAARSQIKVEAALNTRAELETLADGLVRLTAFRLTQQSDTSPERLAIDGTPVQCQLDGMFADIRINDVAGLIDINSASAEILLMLLRGVGAPEAEAAGLAAAIQDFRDGDDATSENGAEALEYQQAGRPYRAKNTPFESVNELDQVLGMTPELLQTLRPFVTVHSRSPILDISVAPLPLLQALARGANAKVAWGSVGVPASREQFQPPTALLTRFNPRSMSRTKSRTFAIDAAVARPGRGRYARHAVIEVAGRARSGFIIREWSSPAPGVAPDIAVPESDKPCIRFE